MSETQYLPSTTRIEAFSDGVIAIIITIMVLELKVPHLPEYFSLSLGSEALIGILPKILSYAISFLVVAIFWVNHHGFFHALERSDSALLWHNNHLLFWLSLIPFTTAFLGEHPHTSLGSILYGGVLVMASLSFHFMSIHAGRARLYYPAFQESFAVKARKKGLIGPSLYLLATISAPISVYISLCIFVIVPLMYFVPVELE